MAVFPDGVEGPPRHVFVTAGGDFTGCKYREVRRILRGTLYSGGSRPGIGDDIHLKGGHRGRFPHRVGLLGGRRGVRLMQPITHDIADAAQRMGAPSERWVVEQIRAGRFPARKIGRTWRMTEQDIADALDVCRNNVSTSSDGPVQRSGLTATSSKRLTAMWNGRKS